PTAPRAAPEGAVMSSRTSRVARVERAVGVGLADDLTPPGVATSLDAYLRAVLIDRVPEAQPFARVAEPWQMDLLEAMVPAVEAVAGLRPDYRGPMSFWRTLPRGHDKTSSIGRLCCWLLAYAPRRLSLAAGAGDSDQAEILGEAMKAEAALNPWLMAR